ncbi:MAG: glycosyltransferase family 4 protein, partial [Deferribacteres bacterium]|nr:glycosyltransferase family 4 protein [Deferribacteres bacterium]
YREDIPRLLSIMDIFVHPSGVREGLPLAVAEAMACGIPVIAGDVGGTPEIVKHGETGLLVPPGDIYALAESIAFLVENPEKAREMGMKGRELVEERFSSSLMVSKVESLYGRLMTLHKLAGEPAVIPL